MSPVDPRPSSRKVASRAEWDAIVLEKAGPCRGCGERATSFHHVVPRSLGGDDVAANIIPLCGGGTVGCHGALENHTPGWEAIAAAVRHSLTPLELQYALAKKGKRWLERYLPHGLLCASCSKPVQPAEPKPEGELPRREPRRKKDWTLKVPDDSEDGWDVLESLTDGLAVDLGFTDEGSRLRRYHAVNAALVFATINKEQFLQEVRGG